MLDAVRTWVLGIFGTALVCGILRALAPEGSGKRALGVVCGFVMALSALGFRGLGDAGSDLSGRELTDRAQALAQEAREAGLAQTRSVIEERCEAYILDKARELGIAPAGVSVTCRWREEGFWVPESCDVDADPDAALMGLIDAELGIPPERQTWRGTDE